MNAAPQQIQLPTVQTKSTDLARPSQAKIPTDGAGAEFTHAYSALGTKTEENVPHDVPVADDLGTHLDADHAGDPESQQTAELEGIDGGEQGAEIGNRSGNDLTSSSTQFVGPSRVPRAYSEEGEISPTASDGKNITAEQTHDRQRVTRDSSRSLEMADRTVPVTDEATAEEADSDGPIASSDEITTLPDTMIGPLTVSAPPPIEGLAATSHIAADLSIASEDGAKLEMMRSEVAEIDTPPTEAELVSPIRMSVAENNIIGALVGEGNVSPVKVPPPDVFTSYVHAKVTREGETATAHSIRAPLVAQNEGIEQSIPIKNQMNDGNGVSSIAPHAVPLDHAADDGPKNASFVAQAQPTSNSTSTSANAATSSGISVTEPALSDLSLVPYRDFAQAEIPRFEALSAPGSTPQAQATTAAQVAQQIVQVAQAQQNGAIEVALSPEELGRIKLTFTPSENGMVISIVGERSDTLDLMRRHVDTLAQEFKDLGYDSVEFSFAQGGGNGSQQEQPNESDKTRVNEEDLGVTVADGIQLNIRTASGRGAVDIRI